MQPKLMTGLRVKRTRVKTAKGRVASSTRWISRQLHDPFVLEAKKQGYRARSAFKIIELNEMFHLFSRGKKVVDLGAAPGGWSQVIAELTANIEFLVSDFDGHLDTGTEVKAEIHRTEIGF